MRDSANSLTGLVGARGFEPRTSCAQGRRATRLRYAPTRAGLILAQLAGSPSGAREVDA